ncbi:MAG: DUF3794 domain-containing protein [Agathobacter sp.]|nr:DUF3794 domain-containing protein [Agathobacter sp.]
MELNKHICTQLVEEEKEFMQITLDDDYIVRDHKPDVVRILYSKGNVSLEDIKVGNQVVWLTGKLYFTTLYQSDDENHQLESVSGEIPFQEKIIIDTREDCDRLTADLQIEDLSVGIINSRKLAVRALLDVEIKCLEEEGEEFTCAILADGYEQKTKELNMLCLVENAKELLQIQKEIMLPNARTNIGELIFYQVDFNNEEIDFIDQRMSFKTNAKVWVLYRSESTGEYECFETIVPLSGEIDAYGMMGDEIYWAKIMPKDVLVEPRSDYDGESRMLGLEVSLWVDLQVYREETCEILEDAYSVEKELKLEREDATYYQLLVKNISKVRLLEQQQIEPHQEKILQICGSSGNVTVDSVEKRENGIQVEGVLNVHIMYTTTEDSMPFAHAEGQVPFEQFVEISGFSENTKLWTEYKLEQLQVNLLDSTEYEIKAVIEIGVLALEEKCIQNIVQIEEEPLDVERLQKEPGMIGYVKKEDEDLWDVAKKYHATPANILEIGNRVLVVKQVH